MIYEDFYREFFPFYESLSSDEKALLCENTTSERFERSESLHDSTECSGVFIVRQGRLRVYMLSEDGREITLYRLAKGDVCMLSASCVLQSITFDVYLDAEEPSECYRISPSAFRELTQTRPEVKIFALEMAVTRFSDVMWVMQQVVFMRQDQRLAIFLLDEAAAGGSDTVTLTHEMIARHLGTAREVVTRLLKHLASDGAIEVTRRGITLLDKKKLRALTR